MQINALLAINQIIVKNNLMKNFGYAFVSKVIRGYR